MLPGCLPTWAPWMCGIAQESQVLEVNAMMWVLSAGGLDMVYVCAGWKHGSPQTIARWEQHLTANTANPQHFAGTYCDSCNHERCQFADGVFLHLVCLTLSSQCEVVCTPAHVLHRSRAGCPACQLAPRLLLLCRLWALPHPTSSWQPAVPRRGSQSAGHPHLPAMPQTITSNTMHSHIAGVSRVPGHTAVDAGAPCADPVLLDTSHSESMQHVLCLPL